jgi:hypothetical protein
MRPPSSLTASGMPLEPPHPTVKSRTRNSFVNAELVDAQTARVATSQTLLPIEIIVKARRGPARFTHHLPPIDTENLRPQPTKPRKYGFGARLPVLTFDGTLIYDMGLETIVFQSLLESPIAADSADNPTFDLPLLIFGRQCRIRAGE